MDYIQEMFAERIGGSSFGKSTELFKFEKIKKAKRLAMQEHPGMELIDLGVGEPDEMADMAIVNKLYEQARIWENRGYADNGIRDFQEAAAAYMQMEYNVDALKPDTEILHSMGSKAMLSMIPSAFINPGDITLLTVPGYPILGTKTEWLGGEVFKLPLLEENSFYPDFGKIPEEILKRAKLLYINYPNNPTGRSATREFFESVVEFARENHIIAVHDAAYAALTFGNTKPLSFLSVPGAKEAGVEIHSLSKAFNMTGWRLGFAAGNEYIIKALAAVKDNNDSGQFKAIQHAGIYALEHPEITAAMCKKYERRHKKLSGMLQRLGFQVQTPDASFYEFVKIPAGTEDGTAFKNAEQFSEYLINQALISTVPWDDAGSYIRISVTFIADGPEKEEEAIRELEQRLRACRLIF